MNINLNLEQLEAVLSMQKKILEQQEFLLESLPIPECIDVKFICKKLKISKAKVYSSPWLMPNFGKSDYPSSTKRWKWSTWEIWHRRNEAERRTDWLSLPVKVKEEIVGVSH